MAPPRPAALSTPITHQQIRIPLALPPVKLLVSNPVPLPPIPAPQLRKALPEVLELARPDQAERADQDGEGQRGGPEDPLVDAHVAHVDRVHAQDGRDGAEGQEDDGHDREGVDGCLLAVLVRVDLLDILRVVLASGELAHGMGTGE
jgi:hypothetical protein